ncbi:3-hydroxybutyrate dehydrogenase [Siccirubricoccus sp. G192]|uniref:3-hydroxybutyrate dehydrogenase n=1 Tax=Siccirubricoccus sp. G192 TaxID=2849651 RepID=UPI001C2CC498|nr:3-hydroxybutyrate dehydrogenase [Siccirubricoccus sp. G192]MBV1800094.1 3-hydroxybutyrate dehydrogenase [Siccirubricoccus sp. G192]
MLKGRTAIITGSTSGIGLGIAETLAAAGAAVMLNGFGDPAQIEEIRRSLAERHGVRVAYSGADLSKPAEVRRMVEQAVAELGAVDILVNNAGIQHVAPIDEFPDDKWDAILAINLSAAFHAIKAAVPGMRERRWGRIVNVASTHGLVASAGKAGYVAAKHGVVGLTKVVALDLANDGITCNAICPGWVLTPLVERQIEARAKEAGMAVQQAKEELLREKQPMLAFTTPEQIGALAVFLCSDGAATMTGTALPIDGGWTAQ